MNHFGYTSGSGREGRQPEVKVGRSAHNAMTLWWVPLRKGVLIQLYDVVVVQILSVIRLARCSHKAVPVRLCLRYCTGRLYSLEYGRALVSDTVELCSFPLAAHRGSEGGTLHPPAPGMSE